MAEKKITDEMAEEATQEPVIKKIYIGPSIPRSGLRHSMILEGTEEEINGFISKLTERYPEIRHLLVTPAALSAAQKKVETKGNILHKYYQDMAAKAATSRMGG